MNKLSIVDMSFAYDQAKIVDNISIQVPSGKFVGIVGPNGSGKSTILKNVYGALTPQKGKILLDGEDILHMKAKAIARKMAVVSQENTVPFNFTVEEIVLMARTPYKRLLQADTNEDYKAVRRALEIVGAAELEKRTFCELSGGEKQRVLIARAFAQETDFILLDEPTNHLDVAYQIQLFDTLKHSGKTILAAIHDLNLALMYCDLVYMLQEMHIVCSGDTQQVLTEERIRDVFRVNCSIEKTRMPGKNTIVYYSGNAGGVS